MEKVNRLAARILNRLEQHKHDLADKQQQIDVRMKELLEQRERLAAVAKQKIETTALSDMPMTSTDQPFRNMSSAFREGMMGGATGGMMR